MRVTTLFFFLFFQKKKKIEFRLRVAIYNADNDTAAAIVPVDYYGISFCQFPLKIAEHR